MLLVRAMDNEQADEVWPRCLEHRLGLGTIPDLMLVSFLVGDAAQFVRRGFEEQRLFSGVLAEDCELLVVIGRTSLKARNCVAAASELCNKCLERDSRRSVAWFTGGN